LAQKCPHTGCQEAKLLHLHLKTCNAGANGECPMQYHGCDQSRKLLAHYRRCRSLRARQHANGSNSTSRQQRRDPANAVANTSPNSAHHCLVCSLMARQARTELERTKVTTSSAYATQTSTSGVAAASIKPNHYKKKGSAAATTRKVSYVLSAVEAEALTSTSRRGKSPSMMPPPPPRSNGTAGNFSAEGSPLDALSRLYATAKHLEQSNDDECDDPAIVAPTPHRRERAASDAEVLRGHRRSLSYNATDGVGGWISNSSLDDDVAQGRRGRSASCGTAPVCHRTTSSPPTCDTIMEEDCLFSA
jgi:hypothetical protein